MSLPYFPMYPADFEADTSHLTLEEDGAYNRLLRLCWMTPGCSLPDDPAWIARRMRIDMATYERVVAPLLVEFFRRGKGRVNSPRLTAIHEETDEKHRRRVDAGKKGGRPAKSLETNGSDLSNAKAMPKQPEPEPEPERESPSDSPVIVRQEPVSSPIKEALALYAQAAERQGWAKVQKLTGARRSALSKRLDDVGGIAGWQDALAKAEASDFLCGRVPSARGSPFSASFDFLIRESSFVKLMEGSYDNRPSPQLTLIPGARYDQSARAQAREDDLRDLVLAAGQPRSR